MKLFTLTFIIFIILVISTYCNCIRLSEGYTNTYYDPHVSMDDAQNYINY